MSVLKDILRPVYYRIPQRIRLGLAFYRDLARYEAMQKLPLDKRREYQLQELQRIVYYAYEYTRYYRRLFDEYGIKPGDIKDFSDMKKIPYLTKDTVRAHREELVADCVREKNLIYVTTGGSTGEPLGFYISKNADRKRLIFEWINWRHMGYMVGDKCAVLRGNIVKNGFFRYDRGHEYLILSTYRMTDELLPRYLEKIEEYKPEVIQGYPSALEIMAKFMLKTGRKLNAALKAISTSSEILYPEQKKMIEEAFNCKVWDKYGNSEQVGVIGMCSAGCYHEFMEHSYLEYEATGEGETYEIVGTSFINDAMPFIRYRTGDLCRLRGGICPCGTESARISRIIGRWHGDLLKTRYGNLISLTALNTHSDIFDHAKRIQYYQDTVGEVILKIVRTKDYTDEDSRKIKAELATKFQNQIKLSLEFVDDIPLTKRGKFKIVDQRLSL